MSQLKTDINTKHVDESISMEGFLDSSNTIIYAARKNADGTISKYNPVGIVQSAGWQESKEINKIYEIGSRTPYMVPGKTQGALSLSRVMISGNDLLNTLYHGTGAEIDVEKFIISLSEIDVPLYIMFVTTGHKTKGTTLSKKYSRVFEEVYITGRSESIGAGQSLILENVSMTYSRISDASVKSV
jgi:hypothetical protein